MLQPVRKRQAWLILQRGSAVACPFGVYAPRYKSNVFGVIYDPSDSSTIFAEDVTKLDQEVIKIENELGCNPKRSFISVDMRIADLEARVAALGG